MSISFNDVNDTELFNAEPRLLAIDTESRLSFSVKKTSPSRAETLDKLARAELRL